VRGALAGLPWVDQDSVKIVSRRQVRITIKDPKQYDEKKLIDALGTEFKNVKVIQRPKI
jgi:hypothetical protein